MKLNTKTRNTNSKSESKRLRREGYIPANLYRQGNDGEGIAISATEFKAILREIKPGHLPTTLFQLVGADKNEKRVIIKEIQYDILYEVIHLDFEELVAEHQINVKIPVECIGVNDCVGIKLGGVLRQVIRHVKVRCLPKDLPTFFQLDVKELNMKQSKRLSDLSIPETVRPLMDLNEVIVVIAKR